MNIVVKTLAAAAIFAFTAGATFAQTPPPAPAHQGILSRLFHPKPKPTMNKMHPGMTPNHYGSMPMHSGTMGGARSYGTMGGHSYGTMGGHSMMGGQIIGNKNSHVYHMAGDRGALPAPQNRVYFSSVAAAQAAGYHAAGAGRGMTTGRPMMHGGMMTH